MKVIKIYGDKDQLVEAQSSGTVEEVFASLSESFKKRGIE